MPVFQQRAPTMQYMLHMALGCMQGPSIAALEKERGPGSFRMAQPPFISDIPSAGMAPPQVRPLT